MRAMNSKIQNIKNENIKLKPSSHKYQRMAFVIYFLGGWKQRKIARVTKYNTDILSSLSEKEKERKN